jgi:hypothetical protein
VSNFVAAYWCEDERGPEVTILTVLRAVSAATAQSMPCVHQCGGTLRLLVTEPMQDLDASGALERLRKRTVQRGK